MNDKLPPINRRQFSKKEEKTKKKLRKTNNNWNDWRFQLYWDKLEGVDPKHQDHKKNPFCTLTYNFYIKDGNKSCHFFGDSRLKPIDYGAFFKRE